MKKKHLKCQLQLLRDARDLADWIKDLNHSPFAKRHILSHIKMINNSILEKDFKSFDSFKSLMKHINIHHSVQPVHGIINSHPSYSHALFVDSFNRTCSIIWNDSTNKFEAILRYPIAEDSYSAFDQFIKRKDSFKQLSADIIL